MKRVWLRRIVYLVLGLVLVGGIVYALLPQPVAVDLVEVIEGTLRVTIDEDGATRIRERYTISAPLSGRLLRVGLDPGDDVARGRLLLAIEPSDPSLLDARSRAEASARVSAARSAVSEAEAALGQVATTLATARRDFEEQRRMFDRGATTAKERDDAEALVQVRTQQHATAAFAVEVARFQRELAEATLIHAGSENAGGAQARMEITAPCDGRVLRLFQESEGYITAGTPLLSFGDTNDLEVVIDVLSTDAVSIRPGDTVEIEHWGGNQPIHGRVRVIEPAAFTKVSSLGVEEQRVNIIIDFTDPPDARPGLGDAYRVEASIVTWQQDGVLKVPGSSLFKHGTDWAVYRVIDDRAVRTPVVVGRRNGRDAQVLEGLQAGDQVIAYPSDQVADGVRVRQR